MSLYENSSGATGGRRVGLRRRRSGWAWAGLQQLVRRIEIDHTHSVRG